MGRMGRTEEMAVTVIFLASYRARFVTGPVLLTLMETAIATSMQLIVSPHYYYPTDHGWKFEGTLMDLRVVVPIGLSNSNPT